MPKWFDKAEVNTGRQPEFDYLKGFFMVLIYIVHAFQTTLSPEDTAMKLIYIFNSVSGAMLRKHDHHTVFILKQIKLGYIRGSGHHVSVVIIIVIAQTVHIDI